ncbi:VOC family protein [Paenibacillus guangzhouensis]|uniref:hypothetical protein n=1 Tax=Paenibacillus guangzhouensis TaxID=1473112 RepID=UPI0012672756|nr:hypothetical protein [Paenibacillus guangzhouensis]
MNRIIPILPCQSVKEQVAFYEQLGFETVEWITRPMTSNVKSATGKIPRTGLPRISSKMLEKFFPSDIHSIQADALDLAKILLVAIDLHIERNGEAPQAMHEKIRSLMQDNDTGQESWQRISLRYDPRVRGN